MWVLSSDPVAIMGYVCKQTGFKLQDMVHEKNSYVRSFKYALESAPTVEFKCPLGVSSVELSLGPLI